MATDPTGNSVIPSDSSSPIATTGSQTPLCDLLNEALIEPARNEFQPPELGIVNPSSAQPGLNKSNNRTGPTILLIDSPGVNHPIPGGHKHHSDSPLQEVHRLLDRATEGYAQRQGHGRLYALLWAKDCSLHCHLSQFPAGFESDNGNYYLSGLHPDPIGRLPGPTADTKIDLWHFAPSKEELKYFSNFARDAGAALLRLRPSWLDVRNPTPESDCLWVEALFFHPPSGESQGDPTFPKPLSIMNPWAASMFLLRTMLDATQHRSTVPGGTEQLPVVATPSTQFIPLTGWHEILAALNEPHGKVVVWKQTQSIKDKIRKLNETHSGPINFPNKRGAQPYVGKSALMTWWGGLEENFAVQTEELEAKAKSERLTVSGSHNYGAGGTVIPEISGSVKPSRATGEKGKEGER